MPLTRALLIGSFLLLATIARASDTTELIQRGQRERNEGKHAQSIATLTEALSIAEAQSDEKARTTILRELGISHWYRDDNDLARDYYQRSLSLAERLGDNAAAALALNSLGALSAEGSRWDEALEYYRNGLALAEESADRVAIARLLVSNGIAVREQGKFSESIALFTRALALRKELGDESGVAAVVNHLGAAWRALGDSDRATDMFREAVDTQRRLGNRSAEAVALENLAVQTIVARDESAVEYLERALQIHETLSDKAGMARVLVHLANFLGGGRDPRSGELYAKALELFTQVNYKDGIASSLSSLARHALWWDRPCESLEYAERGRAVAGSVGSRWRVNTAAAAGMAYAALGSGDAAIAAFRDAIAELERWRENIPAQHRATYFATQRELFDEYISSAMTLHRLGKGEQFAETALAVSEQSRARSLLDTLREARITQPVPGTAAATIGTGEIRELLDSSTALVEFSLGLDASHVWVVTSGDVIAATLPRRDDIDERVRRAYEAITARQPVLGDTAASRRKRAEAAEPALRESVEWLARTLLDPIKTALDRKRIVIVADGALQYFPFALLDSPTAPGRPFIATHELVYLPSASILPFLRRGAERRVESVVVVADPVFEADDPRVGITQRVPRPAPEFNVRAITGGSDSIPRLLFSRQEALAIRDIAKPLDVRPLLDFAANRTAALDPALAEADIIHFATHAVLDEETPERSGIVLSLVDRKGKPVSGFVRLRDIYSLRLPADMVVLSACSTALGKDIRGEGLIGLTRGFIHAGARRVVASLWRVDDEATAELMKSFYRFLINEKRPAPEALRRAQLELRSQKRWQSPYYWSAFVLQGDWR